ncbi:hypothetical protein WAK64_15805 [Bacillus spongiae]|uniref:Uncharacterized protein n=1 Tax=Bacillus spongiae TaxID=2683610 RepID=A0ABU8HGV3_9BACI
MTLSKRDAEKLFHLRFKRPNYAEEVYPQDIYEYDKSTWIVGGRTVPSTKVLCDEKMYRQGTWIPSITDLLEWFDENECTFTMTYNDLSYKIEALDINEQYYKGKGISAEFGLLNVIIQILTKYGGSPVTKTYTVIEAELVDDEDLNVH